MKNIIINLSPDKSRNNFTPVALSMAFLTGMFVAIQAFYFRDSLSLTPLQNSVPKDRII